MQTYRQTCVVVSWRGEARYGEIRETVKDRRGSVRSGVQVPAQGDGTSRGDQKVSGERR